MNAQISWQRMPSNKTAKSSLGKSLWLNLGVGHSYQHEVPDFKPPGATGRAILEIPDVFTTQGTGFAGASGMIFVAALTLNQNLLLSEFLFLPLSCNLIPYTLSLRPSTLYLILQPSTYTPTKQKSPAGRITCGALNRTCYNYSFSALRSSISFFRASISSL